MTHFMVDIETLGNTPRSVIAQIAAASFDPRTGDIYDEFSVNVDTRSSQRIGAEITADTVLWWMRQNPQAQASVFQNTVPIQSAIEAFTEWLFIQEAGPERIMWANSPSFDLTILKETYHMIGLPVIPWGYWNERDYRTICAMAPEIKENFDWSGIAHEAMSDVRNQIRVLAETLKHLEINL